MELIKTKFSADLIIKDEISEEIQNFRSIIIYDNRK